MVSYTPPEGYEKIEDGKRKVEEEWYEYVVYRKYVDKVGGHAKATVPRYHVVFSDGANIETETVEWPPSRLRGLFRILLAKPTRLEAVFAKLIKKLHTTNN
jgi:hypothetical protein